MDLRYQALLFDMDGTLVDSTACVEQTWGEWARRHRIPLDQLLAYSHGRRTADTLRHFAPGLDAEAEAARLEAGAFARPEGIVALPGAQRLLSTLAAEHWAVVTSAPRALAQARLRFAGLPEPPVLVGADDVRRGKPDPEGYLKAAGLLGATPARCLVLEDTPAGIQAARAAGMQVLAVGTTFPATELLGAAWVPHFEEVRFRPTP